MPTIAIITARGGSKRIPRKNIRAFCGKPIIAYSIEVAKAIGFFDEVMVSTDDPDIAEIARGFGATIPFIRSLETSDDHSTTADVLVEVLGEYKKRGRYFDIGCCLYPTAPFVTQEILATGLHILMKNPAFDTVVPVVRFGYPIQRALKIDNQRLSMIWPENCNKRSQDLVPAYHDVGQFYWFRVEPFLRNRLLFSPTTAPIVVPEWSMQDIDNENDWIIAEAKYEVLQRRKLQGICAEPNYR